MGEDARTNGTPALTIAEGDPARIREQIDQTRLALGDTVAALAAKTDVKHQARERVASARQQARGKRDELLHRAHDTRPGATDRATHLAQSARARARAHPLPLIAAGAVLAGFLLGRASAR